ncbi:MAG: SUMF1/EgtB/PvdO family nonheme iron enzyme [Nitrospira sp.]|nr:SUMF1/EgtB/PvdO family nonheme iron enzyme [Nitrospira sp.]
MRSNPYQYKAFVSSTFEDLKDHRTHVIRQLRRAGFYVDPMEDWPADRDEPKQFSQARLVDCDLCVLLVAFRRGYVPEGERRSITQLEYDVALKQGVDILPLLLDENEAWTRKFDERKFDEEGKQDDTTEIAKWRESLRKSHGVELFKQVSHSIEMIGALGRWLMDKRRFQTGVNMIAPVDWPDRKSPYPGLVWFKQDYAPLFFGRDREVTELIGKMREPGGRVLLVVGASGSGKSSLVDAGVWQAIIKEGQLPGSDSWIWCRIQPSEAETSPFEALALGLKDALQLSTRPQFAATGRTLQGLLSKHLSKGQELILFVDQLEELFTRGFKAPDIQAFLEQLISTAKDKANRLWVVAAMRSEFIGKLEGFNATLTILNSDYTYHVGPVSPRALQDMIEKPALATGYKFERGLVDRMLQDAGQEVGNLPLVAYALKQLSEHSENRRFTIKVYDAMASEVVMANGETPKLNGVVGAIRTKANEVLSGLSKEVQGAFDAVFAELAHLERERSPTRRRARLLQFSSDQAAVKLIEALAGQDCRVLVTSESGQETVVEVAHEKLFTAWPKLKEWIDKSGEALRLIEHAEEEARRWCDRGDKPEELWLGSRVKEVLAALQQFGKHPSPVLSRFLRPQHLLIGQLANRALSHELRARIGKILNEFGDPRAGIGCRSNGLPDILWIEIPEGKVKLKGIDHVFNVKPFRLAKYLVTNNQFGAFLRAEDGYRNDEWWRNILQSHGAAQPSWPEANCPREMVSWYEAVAFCRWLSARTGSNIYLPTEWEWQQAATGGDPERMYPWEDWWDSSNCNSGGSQLNRTTTVGMYLFGGTPQGVLDMAGNVWEWCLNRSNEEDTIITKGGRRAIRGGSWSGTSETLRVSFRDWDGAHIRDGIIGFRPAQEIES